ncbi:hypothetical protein DIPPA_51154 [Diplonema papillatum]|nr:hypothetical protein DIPPA_51154 [Diplonema papillatum]
MNTKPQEEMEKDAVVAEATEEVLGGPQRDGVPGQRVLLNNPSEVKTRSEMQQHQHESDGDSNEAPIDGASMLVPKERVDTGQTNVSEQGAKGSGKEDLVPIQAEKKDGNADVTNEQEAIRNPARGSEGEKEAQGRLMTDIVVPLSRGEPTEPATGAGAAVLEADRSAAIAEEATKENAGHLTEKVNGEIIENEQVSLEGPANGADEVNSDERPSEQTTDQGKGAVPSIEGKTKADNEATGLEEVPYPNTSSGKRLVESKAKDPKESKQHLNAGRPMGARPVSAGISNKRSGSATFSPPTTPGTATHRPRSATPMKRTMSISRESGRVGTQGHTTNDAKGKKQSLFDDAITREHSSTERALTIERARESLLTVAIPQLRAEMKRLAAVSDAFIGIAEEEASLLRKARKHKAERSALTASLSGLNLADERLFSAVNASTETLSCLHRQLLSEFSTLALVSANLLHARTALLSNQERDPIEEAYLSPAEERELVTVRPSRATAQIMSDLQAPIMTAVVCIISLAIYQPTLVHEANNGALKGSIKVETKAALSETRAMLCAACVCVVVSCAVPYTAISSPSKGLDACAASVCIVVLADVNREHQGTHIPDLATLNRRIEEATKLKFELSEREKRHQARDKEWKDDVVRLDRLKRNVSWAEENYVTKRQQLRDTQRLLFREQMTLVDDLARLQQREATLKVKEADGQHRKGEMKELILEAQSQLQEAKSAVDRLRNDSEATCAAHKQITKELEETKSHLELITKQEEKQQLLDQRQDVMSSKVDSLQASVVSLTSTTANLQSVLVSRLSHLQHLAAQSSVSIHNTTSFTLASCHESVEFPFSYPLDSVDIVPSLVISHKQRTKTTYLDASPRGSVPHLREHLSKGHCGMDSPRKAVCCLRSQKASLPTSPSHLREVLAFDTLKENHLSVRALGDLFARVASRFVELERDTGTRGTASSAKVHESLANSAVPPSENIFPARLSRQDKQTVREAISQEAKLRQHQQVLDCLLSCPVAFNALGWSKNGENTGNQATADLASRRLPRMVCSPHDKHSLEPAVLSAPRGLNDAVLHRQGSKAFHVWRSSSEKVVLKQRMALLAEREEILTRALALIRSKSEHSWGTFKCSLKAVALCSTPALSDISQECLGLFSSSPNGAIVHTQAPSSQRGPLSIPGTVGRPLTAPAIQCAQSRKQPRIQCDSLFLAQAPTSIQMAYLPTIPQQGK